MDVLPCGHAAYSGHLRTCSHLAVEEPPPSVRCLTGIGVQYDLRCRECADNPESDLIEVCEGCARNADERSHAGWRGEPEIRLRDKELPGTWATWDCPVQPVNDRCLAPLPHGWLAFTVEGLVAIDDIGTRSTIGAVDIPAEEPDEWRGHARGPALYTSQDGQFAAVVTDYGCYGTVVDLRTREQILALDREHYHSETTPFPFAFMGTGLDTRIVAATDWNRLDAFNSTGRLLTDRVTAWESAHYLDYFHGGLTLSPSGRWLLDDGWVWHPVGIPMLLDAGAWLAGDSYATEEGLTLGQRDYAWDQPVAWLNDNHVAIQRIGEDDEAMIDGVDIFDVRTGQRTGRFAGPAGPMWGHDNHLYVRAKSALEVWSAAEEARIGRLDGFSPTAFNPVERSFAELGNGLLRIWTSVL